VESIKLVETIGMVHRKERGLKSAVYRFGVKLLSFGITVYGKFNQIPILALSPVCEFVEPCAYGL
jgi:hypothetical protein